MFKGKKGQQLAAEVGKKSKTFVPGEDLPEKRATPSGPSKEDIEAIKVTLPALLLAQICVMLSKLKKCILNESV